MYLLRNCVPSALNTYVFTKESIFYKFHFSKKPDPKGWYNKSEEDFTADWDKFKKLLKDFLCATNDAVRIDLSEKVSERLLYRVDMLDADYFRKAVLRREIAADIDYPKQRDHSAHTLNNYILGWFFYEKSNIINKHINEEISKRKKLTTASLDSDDAWFAHVWIYASLLHDIGYIFEGALHVSSTEPGNERTARGAAIIHNYFNHRFWSQLDIDFHSAVKLMKQCHLHVPNFHDVSDIVPLGDHLCILGDCEPIRKKLREELSSLPIILKIEYNVDYAPNTKGLLIYDFYKKLDEDFSLDLDPFALWKYHYEYFNSAAMGRRMLLLRQAFLDAINVNDPGTSFRMLDHGVCSGLIGLKYSTFFYTLYHAMNYLSEKNLLNNFQYFCDTIGISYRENKLKPSEATTSGNDLCSPNAGGSQKSSSKKLEAQEKVLCTISSLEKAVNELKSIQALENPDRIKRLIADCERNLDDNSFIKKLTLLHNEIDRQIRAFSSRANMNALIKYVTETCIPDHFNDYTASSWWARVLWGTAAAAVHNVFQKKNDDRKMLPSDLSKKLSLSDDPIAYLGILVDILQTWDRYNVDRGSVVEGKVPVQACDMKLRVENNKIYIDYNDLSLAKNIREELDNCLNEWNELIQVLPVESEQ